MVSLPLSCYSFLALSAWVALSLIPPMSSTTCEEYGSVIEETTIPMSHGASPATCGDQGFKIEETTILKIHEAFLEYQLTSAQLVECYQNDINRLNSIVHSVIEVNPDARALAEKADAERTGRGSSTGLQGIPVLLKDNIATNDTLNTTAGSLALLGLKVPRDAGVVEKLRKAGAIILGKVSLTEWAGFRDLNMPPGWNGRSGQTKNPYSENADPGGSSTGSAVSVSANMVTVSLGTETDGSIIYPSSCNSVVGIKPTVGLAGRSGVIPISLRQDTVGPIARSVSDAVYLLDAIVGTDERDNATQEAAKFIPIGGYLQYLNPSGLSGKRLGVRLEGLGDYYNKSIPDELVKSQIFDNISQIITDRNAAIITNLSIPEYNLSFMLDREFVALLYEFKISLEIYLHFLQQGNVRRLKDVIAFNDKPENRAAVRKKIDDYGQKIFMEAENLNMTVEEHYAIIQKLHDLSVGFETFMKTNNLDAFVFPENFESTILAIGGYPAITVPAGYDSRNVPFGITFAGLSGSEPTLIQIANGFEEAVKGTAYARKPP